MVIVVLHEDGTYDQREVIESGIEVYEDGGKAYRIRTSRVQEWTAYNNGGLARPDIDLKEVPLDATVEALGVWRDVCAWPVVAPTEDQSQEVLAMRHDLRRLKAGAYSAARDEAISQASRSYRLSALVIAILASILVLMAPLIIVGRLAGWL